MPPAPTRPILGASYNSTGGSITIVPRTAALGPGNYQVQFGKLLDASDGNAQVSAYGTNGYCLVGYVGLLAGSSDSMAADVNCFDSSGNPANQYFTLLVQSRKGTLGSADKGVAYITTNGLCTLMGPCTSGYDESRSYNSTGGTNTIFRNGLGNYTVTLPGLTKVGGDVQANCITGVSLSPGKVSGWASVSSGTGVTILCFDKTGAPADEFFSFAYALNEPFGLKPSATSLGAYAWADQAASTSVYTPDTRYQYNGFGTGNLTAQKTGTGLYTVTIPGSISYKTSTVLVTAYGGGSNYCNVVNWAQHTINIGCYNHG